ncbi:MAG: TRAP transporter small permease [Synergistaceae bacterium]|jgi:TRAP-type C4-dicarboxylate transport system permease small subunit|nr:TRAP transporter small permease [Synergistaceae bacterium]
MKALNMIVDVVEKILLWVSMFMLAAMSCLLLVQIFCRFVLNSPLFWVEEIVRLCQIWIVFLVSPLVVRRGEHPGFKALPLMLPLKGRKFIWILSMCLIILVGASIGWYGIQLSLTSNFTSANGIPRYWNIIPVVIGGFWVIVVALQKIYEIICLTEGDAENWRL